MRTLNLPPHIYAPNGETVKSKGEFTLVFPSGIKRELAIAKHGSGKWTIYDVPTGAQILTLHNSFKWQGNQSIDEAHNHLLQKMPRREQRDGLLSRLNSLPILNT